MAVVAAGEFIEFAKERGQIRQLGRVSFALLRRDFKALRTAGHGRVRASRRAATTSSISRPRRSSTIMTPAVTRRGIRLVCLIMPAFDDLSVISSRTRPDRRQRSGWWIVFVAPFAGAGLGVVARCWMRLITDDPEFSWSGTVFIVVAFTIAGARHALRSGSRMTSPPPMSDRSRVYVKTLYGFDHVVRMAGA